MIRRLIILLLIVGCENFAPTNHTHTDTGETVNDTLFAYGTLINYDTLIINNYDTTIVYNYDTLIITNYDTTIVYDTLIVLDTLVIERMDCNGVQGGTAQFDNCGVCDSNLSNDCMPDCAGTWGGTAELDCKGLCGGVATVDNCGVCDGGNADQDCAGVCGGTASCYGCTTPSACNFDANATIFDDSCWSATEGCACTDGEGSIADKCGTCDTGPSNDCVQDCNEEWGGDAVVDECDDCVGGNTGETACLQDCNNEWGGDGSSCYYCGDLTEVELWGVVYDIATTTEIFLPMQELSGSIDPNIGCLTNLTSLSLSSNQLTGEIPSEIGNLTNLTYLHLSKNQLTGEIPPEIGNLTNLTSLYLHDNQLTGEIPESICNIPNLQIFYIYCNNFSIPYQNLPSCLDEEELLQYENANCTE